jgi:hypothetical protein
MEYAPAIRMYFVESKFGEFRIYLDSSIFCDYMERVDEIGVYRNEMELFVLEALNAMHQKSGHIIELDFESDDIDLEALHEMNKNSEYASESEFELEYMTDSEAYADMIEDMEGEYLKELLEETKPKQAKQSGESKKPAKEL